MLNKKPYIDMHAETLNSSLITNLPDGIFVVNEQNTIVLWNKAMEELSGYSSVEVIGKDKLYLQPHILHGIDLENIHESSCKERIHYPAVGLHFEKTDYISFFSLTISPLFVENKYAGIYFVIHRIPEKVIKDLKESEAKYRTVFSNSFIPAYVCDTQTLKILEINEAFTDLYGYSAQEALKITILDISLEPEETEKKLNHILKVKRAYIPIRYHKTQSGEKITVEIYSGLVDYAGKQLMICLINNISDRIETIDRLKNYALELESSNATKNRMFSIISHDLRGPAGNLKVIFDYMISEHKDSFNEDAKSIIKMANESILSIYTLLENLLNWAQNQWNQIAFSPRQLSVEDIVFQVTTLFATTLSNKEINLQLELNGNKEIIADENMLSSILRNMLSNAIKFTKNKGNITIISENKEDFLYIGVRDSGIGISAQAIAKILDKSEIYTTFGTNNEKGSGLGVNLCREFAIKHGGELYIESTPGVGSYFSVSFPLNSSLLRK